MSSKKSEEKWWKQIKMAGPITASTGAGSATTPGLETRPIYGRKKDEEVTEEEFYDTKKEDEDIETGLAEVAEEMDKVTQSLEIAFAAIQQKLKEIGGEDAEN